MTNEKVFLTLNWEDQNCHLSFLTTTDSYHFLVNTACKEKRPLDFHKAANIIKKQLCHQYSWFYINLELACLLCPVFHETFMFCIYAETITFNSIEGFSLGNI